MYTSSSFIPVALLLAVVWVGCGERATESEGPGEDSRGRLGVSLSTLVDAGIDPPLTDSLPVLDELQPPRRVEREPRENRHVQGQMDTLRTYVYRGLEFTVYDVADDSKEIMKSITATDSTYETDEGLRVGLSRERAQALLGPPDQSKGDTLTYHLGTPVPNLLHVTYENDRITQLKWSFYVD